MPCILCDTVNTATFSGLKSNLCYKCLYQFPKEYRRSDAVGWNSYYPVNGAMIYVNGIQKTVCNVPPFTRYEGQSQEEYLSDVIYTEGPEYVRWLISNRSFYAKYYPMCKKYNEEFQERHKKIAACSLLKNIRGRQKKVRNTNPLYFTNLTRPPGHWQFNYAAWHGFVVDRFNALETECLMAAL